MALTPPLVARVHRDVADGGLAALGGGVIPLSEADYDALAARLLAEHEAHRRDPAYAADHRFWVFAYGSLIWRPACATEAQVHARLRGWHRRFCMRLTRWRGTADCPGLMMALERGGSCHGVIQRLPADGLDDALGALVRRETSVRPMTNSPRWVFVDAAGRRIPALAFTVDRSGAFYAGRVDLDATADILAQACGHWGSGAEYLMNTVSHLEALGIHDRYLWRLQEMVAARIAAQASEGVAPEDAAPEDAAVPD